MINQEPAFVDFTLKRFVYLFGITLATPLFPLYFVRELNASDAWIGFVYTAQTAVLVVGYFFWTRQSRKRGSRFVLLATTFSVALYPGLVALTNNQSLIFILASVAGIFQAGIDLVFFDELMKTIPPKYSPTFVSLAQSITYLAAILAPLVGTYLSERIGITGALLFSTVICFIGFILFYHQGRPRDLIPQSTSTPLDEIPGE